MPEYVFNRTHTHRSTFGHIINFVKGQPVYVPPVCEREATALGAEPVEGARMDLVEDDSAVQHLPTDPQGEERTRALLACFEALENRNQRGDFTGQGRPNTKVVASLVGFQIENRERDDVWEQYKNLKA